MAAVIPLRVDGEDRRRAPSPSASCRGRAPPPRARAAPRRNSSRQMLEMIGTTMIVRIRPAVNRPVPAATALPKIGMKPSVRCSQGSTWSRGTGRARRCPRGRGRRSGSPRASRPAWRRCRGRPSGPARSDRGRSRSQIGVARTSAIADVTTVPKMKRGAPKIALDRVPACVGEEAQPELADREARAVEDLLGDRTDQDDRRDAGAERDAVERGVAEAVAEAAATEREGAARLDRCRLHEAETTGAGRGVSARSPPRHQADTIRQPSPHRHKSVTPFDPLPRGGAILTPNNLGHSEEEQSLEKKDSHPSAVAALAVALAAVGSAGAHTSGTSTAKAGSLTGAGSSFVFPLVSQWIPAVNSALGIHVTYGAVGSRRRHRADHRPHGRLRRQRRAAGAAQFGACNGCVQIPWALVGDGDRLQPPRASGPAQADGPRDREHLPRQDQEVERPGDPAAQPGRNPPATGITVIHRSDGSGTTYNFTEYLTRSARPGRRRSARARPSTGRRASAARAARASPASLSHTNGGITYIDVAYALANHFKFAAVRNRAGTLHAPGPAQHQGRGARRSKRVAAEQRRDLDRQPVEAARSSPTRSARSRT